MLIAWEKVQLARHPQRPHTADYVRGLFEHFVELHGDRYFGDDPAIIGGLAQFAGQTVVVVGHQKGMNTRENIRRNYGMPRPEGHRKALRLFLHAEKFGFPLLCFIDTPGADPGMQSEERGQSNSIAANLMVLAALKVPIVATVIGEGGSGGALAISLCNRLLMLEHSIYSVASPEASAAILWRDSSQAPEAARMMRVTAQDLYEFAIADAIIPEPECGAHTDPKMAITAVGAAIRRHLDELMPMNTAALQHERYLKYRKIGQVYQRQDQVAIRLRSNLLDHESQCAL